MREKILCIEDDLTMQTLITASLPEFEVICVKTLADAEKALVELNFQALLIDIHLPDGDGLRFLTKIYQQEKLKRVPVLVLSSHSEISNKVMAFTLGAEDFIAKPFDPIELNARISAKIRRSRAEAEVAKVRQLGNMLIDFDRQKVFKTESGKEKDLGLTSIELKILTLLTKRLEQVYSRDQIMNQVWGETFIADRTVDSHVAHLRTKISSTRIEVETAKNFGYRAVLKP